MTFAEQVAARTLAQEARGEPLIGQQAVAQVLVNRLHTGRWGKSLASVCLWHAQFSGWYVPSDPNFAYACDLADDDPVLVHMAGLIDTALACADDPTDGATHYFANSMPVPPAWSQTMRFCGQFGNQSFYSDQPPKVTVTA
jgi:spore germination cell wall hydrolase CwlJ-like protein